MSGEPIGRATSGSYFGARRTHEPPVRTDTGCGVTRSHAPVGLALVGDCVEGTRRILHGDCAEPLNLGSDELISIDGLVSLFEAFAGVELEREYDLSKPQGVSGRNSGDSRIERELGWSPSTTLREGMRRTYEWIEGEVRKDLEGSREEPSVFAVSA